MLITRATHALVCPDQLEALMGRAQGLIAQAAHSLDCLNHLEVVPAELVAGGLGHRYAAA